MNDWLLFAEQPSPRHTGKTEATWARPVGADLALLRRLIPKLAWSVAERLLSSRLAEDVRQVVTEELLAQLAPVTDAETLAALVRTASLVKAKQPDASDEWLEALLARAAPDYQWQLWLRYRSPLVSWPAVAERVINLVNEEPDLVSAWWSTAAQTGVPGLYLAYVDRASTEELVGKWQQLKRALGSEQASVYHETAKQWLEQVSELTTAAEYLRYQQVLRTTMGDKQVLEELLVARLAPGAALELWLTGEKLPFPQAEALAQFATLPAREGDLVAAQLDEEELGNVAGLLTASHSAATQKRAWQWLQSRVARTFSALALDLESNRETIHEIAWGTLGAWHVGQGKEEVAVVLEELAERVAAGSYLTVGHNVRGFDAPVLAAHGVMLATASLWDTLLVEMALSPQLQTYALRTAHTAAADAQLVLDLFVNQVVRLVLTEPADWELLSSLFATDIRVTVGVMRDELASWPWLQESQPQLWQEAWEWLRPQPADSTLRQQVQAWVAGAAPGAILVAPREAWAEALLRSPVQLWADEQTAVGYRALRPAAVVQQLAAHPTEHVLLGRFMAHCQQQGWPVLGANMAPALQARLRELKIDLGACLLTLPAGARARGQGVWGLSVEQLRHEQATLREQTDLAIAVVEPDLITLGNKKELLQLLADEVRSNAATSAEWLKFSGGQSFIALTRTQARQLGAAPPDDYDNFWLEKHQYGQYRVWASFGWEKLVQELAAPGHPVETISSQARSYPARQLRSAGPPTQRLQQQLGVVPLNPETIYRSRYWLLQTELTVGIAERGTQPLPLVLLVQRPEEVGRLENYFGPDGRGFYIPSREAQLARRLELLHQRGEGRGLLVAPVSEAAAILEANYLGPLRVVLDSFNLLENYYLAQGSRLFEAARRAVAEQTKDGTEEVDEAESTATSELAAGSDEDAEAADLGILERNLLFLLELQRPLVQRLRALVADDDTQSQLWLLDPRLADFAGLARTWQFDRETVGVPWQKREEYEAAAQLADRHLGGVRPDTDFALDLDKARELLRQVFLRDPTDPTRERVHEWRPKQLLCLDDILPAQTDLVVTLATGGGKSVLFQAPALYRSSYTNRLSIVVTPLRALMEDQVTKLWELGFYSSVECINSDKQDELGQIYRRVAGGEIQLLFITPERFRSNGFSKAFAQRFALDGGLEYAIFDEAHCISQWGHEFRPDYLHSARHVQRLRLGALQDYERRFPILLFSATVTEKILANFNNLFPDHEATR
ncbi:MAG: DEAD/DEAH box helicase [Janthinobacterium lividum]